MAAKKKKSGKPKRKPQGDRHYGGVCGKHKANEKLSGRGHATHICKACASKSPAQKSEDMTINRLHGMMFRYLSESEIKWLKNRRNDSRPEVSELAKQIFEEKFQRQARSEIKARLHIKNITFHFRGDVMNEYGDEFYVNAQFTADTTGKIIKKLFDEHEVIIEEKSAEIGIKAARKFFNVMVHNYDISFWETDLCLEISNDPYIDLLPDFLDDDDFEHVDVEGNEFNDYETEPSGTTEEEAPDDRIPAWSIEIKYKNGTEQTTKGYDYIPDPVMGLFDHFESYFEEEMLDEDFADELDEDETV
jgi:hypothetical protein